ncbi:MAG: hypothetical protein AB4063_09510 [Crocosphaera sp.]
MFPPKFRYKASQCHGEKIKKILLVNPSITEEVISVISLFSDRLSVSLLGRNYAIHYLVTVARGLTLANILFIYLLKRVGAYPQLIIINY